MVGLGLGDLYCRRSDICLFYRRDWVKTQTPELFVRKEVARDGRSWSDCEVWVATTGPRALRSALKDLSAKAVRDLAQAAGLRVRKDGTATWLRGDELREALLQHLSPQGSAAPQEFAAFVLCYVFFV